MQETASASKPGAVIGGHFLADYPTNGSGHITQLRECGISDNRFAYRALELSSQARLAMRRGCLGAPLDASLHRCNLKNLAFNHLMAKARSSVLIDQPSDRDIWSDPTISSNRRATSAFDRTVPSVTNASSPRSEQMADTAIGGSRDGKFYPSYRRAGTTNVSPHPRHAKALPAERSFLIASAEIAEPSLSLLTTLTLRAHDNPRHPNGFRYGPLLDQHDRV